MEKRRRKVGAILIFGNILLLFLKQI